MGVDTTIGNDVTLYYWVSFSRSCCNHLEKVAWNQQVIRLIFFHALHKEWSSYNLHLLAHPSMTPCALLQAAPYPRIHHLVLRQHQGVDIDPSCQARLGAIIGQGWSVASNNSEPCEISFLPLHPLWKQWVNSNPPPNPSPFDIHHIWRQHLLHPA